MKGEFFIIRKWIEREIKNIFINDNDKVLDVGCGTDPYYHKLIKGRVVCFDMKKSSSGNIVGDADFLPFKKGSFDKIVIINSFYYFKNPFKVVEDLSRALKKGGRLVMVTPFFYPVHDAPDDKYRFTEFGLRALFGDFFRIDKIEPLGGFFTIPAIILHSLIKGLPLMAPKHLKGLIKIVAYLAFYMPYILAQIIGILDVFDKTKRWPTYYIAIATKKVI